MSQEKQLKKKRISGRGSPEMGGRSSGEDDIAWGELLYGLRKRQWLIYLGLILGGLVGLVVLKTSQTIYQAQAVMMTEAHKKVVNIEEVQTTDLNPQSDLGTFVQIITSRTVLERVASGLKASSQGLNFSNVTEEQLLRELLNTVTATVTPNTRFILVGAEHSDPEKARNIADLVAQEAVKFTVEKGRSVTKGANEFLMTEVNRQREKLKESEQTLQTYKEENKEFFPGGSLFAVAEQYQNLSKSLQSAREERALLEFDAAHAKQVGNDPKELLKLPTVAKAPAVITASAQLAEKQAELDQLARRYKPKHPKYITCVQEVARLERQLNEKIQDAAANVDSLLDQATRRQSDYAAEAKAKEDLAFQVNKKVIQVNALQRDIDTNKVIFDTVLSRLKETDLAKGLQESPLVIYESAVVPGTPIRPKAAKIFAISVGFGLILGLGLAFGLNLFDNSIKTVDEAEALTGYSVLCVVPARVQEKTGKNSGPKATANVKSGAGETSELGLAAADAPHGQIAEGFRTLRASLSLKGSPENQRKYLFTSAFPSEGKSFCCANFAITLASQGMKTLLVDGDLRRPTISTLFYQEKKSPGLGEYLANRSPFVKTVHSTTVANLSIVPAGGLCANPAELLAGIRVKEFLDEALKKYDRVVIDTAPVIAVSDTLTLVKHVDVACLVIWGSKTPRTAVTRATELLTSANAPLAGIILNRLPIRTGSYYNYYYYHTGYYGSEGVYGAPKEGA